MARHLPSGVFASGVPLTAVQTSVAVGLSEFAINNKWFFAKRNTAMILSVIGIPLLFLGILQVVNAALLLVGGLFTLVGVVLFLTGKTNPVVFPDIIVLEHSVTNHAGKSLMVSDHQESLQHHSMHGDFADYRGHTLSSNPTNLWFTRTWVVSSTLSIAPRKLQIRDFILPSGLGTNSRILL